MADTKETTNWPDLFVGLYDRLTGRKSEISYAFENFEVNVPSSTSQTAPKANWKINGTLKITTKDAQE